ncbi:GNAT family N-acetyltransferase [Heyndrickxia sp. NPDC080065]|uniref:GNAT family N-acetyltransferase n=1 Tax=Heyndrickxia sp. NPDC080065 TaxID=3390568 RepID=UPI003D03021D
MFSDLELMEIHVNVLFNSDEQGRITHINEPPYDAAPRFFIGGTRKGPIVRYHKGLSDDVVKKLEEVIGTDPSSRLAEIIYILSQVQPIRSVWIGPAFIFPEVRNRSTKAIQVTQSNKKLLLPHFPYTYDEFEYKEPCFAIVQNDMAVSLCCSARQTSKGDEASLYTLEEFRGKGYGVDVSNAWAREVQKQGRLALYSTSWDNFSSQSVAKKLQLIQYGTDIHLS